MKNTLWDRVIVMLSVIFVFLFSFGNTSNFAYADDLADMNQEESILDRVFYLEPSVIYEVTANTGVTAPDKFTVSLNPLITSDDLPVIDYGNFYSGFTVNNNVSLYLKNLSVINAVSSNSGSVINNSGNVSIQNVNFIGNKVVSTTSANGGVIANSGNISAIVGDFRNNSVSATTMALGGAICNMGTITSISGNFIGNYAKVSSPSDSTALGGAIYTISSIKLEASGEHYNISGNYVQVGDDAPYSQAIYVELPTAKVTISATNGGSWTITDDISGTFGSYYGLELKGDRNSFIKLLGNVKNADVEINYINLFIGPNTFADEKNRVTITGSVLVSLLDNSINDYTINVLDTTQASAPDFEFDVNVNTSDKLVLTNESLAPNIIVKNLNFLNGSVVEGTYRLLQSDINSRLVLTSGENSNSASYSYSNITPVLNWDSVVYSYDYILTLTSYDGTTMDSVIVSDISAPHNLDNLAAINQFNTTYDRQLNFESGDSNNPIVEFSVSSNTGLSAYMSPLKLNGKSFGDEFTKIKYNNHSGFLMGTGALIEVDNIEFYNAYSQDNGSIVNIYQSNASFVYNNGVVHSNSAQYLGGAFYVSGNSFLNLSNVDFYDNHSYAGGVIYNYSDGTKSPYIVNLSGDFSDNYSNSIGGAIANNTDYSLAPNTISSVLPVYTSMISNITSNFNSNYVFSDSTNVQGGAIYNTGIINNVVGNFEDNYAYSESGYALGGAVANAYIKNGEVFYNGSISSFTSSFIGNYAKSDNSFAYGGAIYTANDLIFNNYSTLVFEDNYTEDISGKKSNAIFVDTSNGKHTLRFNMNANTQTNIKDSIDGGVLDIVTGVVNRGIYEDTNSNQVDSIYRLIFQGTNTTSQLNFYEIYSNVGNTNEEPIILPALINADVVISNVELVFGTKTFADENTSLTINSSVANMQDTYFKEYFINKLVSTTSVDYKIDFIAKLVNNVPVTNADKIIAGSGSSGIIKITDIGLSESAQTDFMNAARYIAFNEPDKYRRITILERENSSDAIVLDVSGIPILSNITEEKKLTDPEYHEAGTNKYVVDNESFIGTIGFALNDTADTFIIGVLEEYDTLRQINTFVNSDETPTPTERIFNIKHSTDTYTYLPDKDNEVNKTGVGYTSIGTFTINGNYGKIDLKGYNGIIVSSSDAFLTINDVTIKGSSAALTSNYVSTSENANIVIENSTFVDNTVSISNVSGKISIINSEISQSTLLNKVNNSENGIISAVDSKFYSPIVNNGLIIIDGNIQIGKSGDSVPIAGKGIVRTTNNENNIINLKNAYITDPADNTYNTFELNNGTVYLGATTLATANFVATKGIIDLSGSLTSSLAVIDQPYVIYNYNYYIDRDDEGKPLYVNGTEDTLSYAGVIVEDKNYTYTYINKSTGIIETATYTKEQVDEGQAIYKPIYDVSYIIDIDFSILKSDSIIVTDPTSVGAISIRRVNGEDTLTPATKADKIPILTSQSRDVILSLDGLEKRDYRFYVSYYNKDPVTGESYNGYVLQDDYFVGELHMKEYQDYKESTNSIIYGIDIIKTPEYNAIVELNSAKNAKDGEGGDYGPFPDFEKAKPRTFKLVISNPSKPYTVPENLGTTYYGTFNIIGSVIDPENNILTPIHMNDKSGFELNDIIPDTAAGYTEPMPTTLNIDTIHIHRARTDNNGSVVYVDTLDSLDTKTILTDVFINDNTSGGLGGAIYSNKDIFIYAKNIDSILSENYQKQNSESPVGKPNDIYFASSNDVNLTLVANAGRTVSLSSGLEVADQTPLILHINDDSQDCGKVAITLNKDLGTYSSPIKNVILNGGTLNLHIYTDKALCSTIYTSDLVISKDTFYEFDIDLVKGIADKIVTNRLRTNSGNGRIILAADNFNFVDNNKLEIASKKIKMVDVLASTSEFIALSDSSEYVNEVDSILLYTINSVDYYARLGLNGEIIIGSSPDCSDDPLVEAILSPNPVTYKLNSDLKLFNYGYDGDTMITDGIMQSKKLSIVGNTYSVLSTPCSITGIIIGNSATIAPSKQQFIGKKFTFQGFNSAIVNNGGKVTLTSVNFVENETDSNGAAIRNNAGKVTLNASKKSYSQLIDNLASNYGGAIYNNDTLTMKYQQVGMSKNNTYSNFAYMGGGLYNSYKATISSSIFENNEADQNGGAIYTNNYLKSTSTIFNLNYAKLGGAIYISNNPEKSAYVTITKNDFLQNSANTGGGLYIDKGYVNIKSSNFGNTNDLSNGNNANTGGALFISDTVVAEEYADKNYTNVTSSKFVSNTANVGGAIYNLGKIKLSKNTFGIQDKANVKYSNNAQYGAAVYNKGDLTDTSSKYSYNIALLDGGAIYNEGTILTYNKNNVITGGLNSVKFVENESMNAGAVYNKGNIAFSKTSFDGNSAAVNGGAILNINNANVINSTFVRNSAADGGAIYNTENMTITKGTIGNSKKKLDYANTAQRGSAIFNSKNLTLSGVNVCYNKTTDTSADKGSIYNDEGGLLAISASSFTGNISGFGGAIYNLANFTTDNKTKFTSNTAVDGGAIYNKSLLPNVYGAVFSKNIALNNGGAIYNDENSTINVNYYDYTYYKKGVEKHTYYNPSFTSNTAINGGAIYNLGTITILNTTFSKNDANNNAAALSSDNKNLSGNGGALYNTSNLTLADSTFSSNSAVTTITDNTIVDEGTKTTYSTTTSYSGGGGAIFNSSDSDLVLKNISFTSNKAGEKGGAVLNANSSAKLYVDGVVFKSNTSLNKTVLKQYSVDNVTNKKSKTTTSTNYDENGKGGAIYSVADVNINADPLNNYDYTTNYDVANRKLSQFVSNSSYSGGAIYSTSKLNISSATFTSNSAKGNGGAIYIADDVLGSKIYNSNFSKNTALSGGALYVGQNSTVNIIDTDFNNNSATEKGGAIYMDENSTVNVFAIATSVQMKGNKAGKTSNSIYMNNATLNLSTKSAQRMTYGIYIYDNIDGSGTINTYGNNIYIVNESSLPPEITLNHSNAVLALASESSLLGSTLNLSGNNTSLNIANNQTNTLSLGSLKVEDNTTSSLIIDMDLGSRKSDTVTANNLTGTGKLNVTKVNLLSNSIKPVEIEQADNSVITDITATRAETDEATYKLKTYLGANGRLRTLVYNQRAKACVLAAPIAAQIGGYLTQINSYDQAFMNMDMNMLKTREERQAELTANKYASFGTSQEYETNGINYNSKGLWTRPYATFERVGLNQGPRVSSISYGNFFGGDADLKEMRNGWARQFSAYIGYNGSVQDYFKQSIDQNGGTIGITEVWYKNNFFTGLTANVSGNMAQASTDLGHENMPMIMAGVASKTGYNWELGGKCKWIIIQPNLLISYSFVHTFSHKNGRGAHVGSSPLNAIQVAPGVKFIFNLPKGWQPYFNINMRWNIMDKAKFSLPDVAVPQMSVHPYVEYGIGVQRKWGERFTGFGQALVRNGGRNGVMLSFGFKWLIGK